MSSDVRALIQREQIHSLFQPILDGSTGEPIGFEALSRGPANSPLHTPDALFAAALQAGCLQELERACTRSAIRSFAELDIQGRLFLNMLPETLLGWPQFPDWLAERLGMANVDAHCVVLELTEHGSVQHESELAAAIRPLRRMGCDIAIDDLGAGSSGLKTWSALRPEFVKVDRYFVAGIEEDPVRGEILRSVVEMARATGSQVVAEGIEIQQQLNLVLELGVDYVQGFLFGQPQSTPRTSGSAFPQQRTLPGLSADCAEHLALSIPPVSSTALVSAAVEMFRRNRAWRALAVVDSTKPIGLVRRDELLVLISRPLHPEIYNRKPVTAVMDTTAVQIDGRARLDQVSRMVTGQQARQQEDFIITRAGRYLGLGRSIDLLRQITAQQIQMAKQANPLTGLPGNREIQAHLGQLVNRRRTFIACHLDLDNFKPFNDTYGYQQGDQVLLHVATAILRNIRPRMDFVGHIGGDDYVLLLRSRDWSIRLLSILEDLAVTLVNFHSAEHRQAGHIMAHGRDGALSRFPLLSVSIAAVEVAAAPGTTLDSVAEELRRTKATAKARSGCSCVLSKEGQMIDLLCNPPLEEFQTSETVILKALGS
jgi:diguanylate cyclase (GGDEF)-like protein